MRRSRERERKEREREREREIERDAIKRQIKKNYKDCKQERKEINE
jgi:hypothetical protein